MYDQHSIVLRIETTTKDASFFKPHRRVEHRKGAASRELATVKKSISSLIDSAWLRPGRHRPLVGTG
jgi:hypothetical protein